MLSHILVKVWRGQAFLLNRKAFQLNRKTFQLNRKVVGKSLMSAQQPTGSLTEATAWEDRVLVYWSVKIRYLNYNVCSSDPLCFSIPKVIFWGEGQWRWCGKFFLLMHCTALSHCREKSPTIVVRRGFIECSSESTWKWWEAWDKCFSSLLHLFQWLASYVKFLQLSWTLKYGPYP